MMENFQNKKKLYISLKNMVMTGGSKNNSILVLGPGFDGTIIKRS